MLYSSKRNEKSAVVHSLKTSSSRTEGLSALWSSTLPSLILVSNPSIQYMVYEALKRRCAYLGVPLSSGTVFTIGAVSKCVATVLTYPIQVRTSIISSALVSSQAMTIGGHHFTYSYSDKKSSPSWPSQKCATAETINR